MCRKFNEKSNIWFDAFTQLLGATNSPMTKEYPSLSHFWWFPVKQKTQEKKPLLPVIDPNFFFFFLSLTFNHTPTRVLCHLTEGSFLIPDMNVLVEYTWLEAENLPNSRPAKSIPGLGTMKLTLQFQQLLPKLGDTRSFPQNTLKLNSKKRSSKLFQNPLKPSFETINLRTVSSFSTKSRPIIIKSEWTEDRKEELKSLLILTSWACFSNCNRSIPDKLPINWISASVISKCGLPVQIHSSIVILVQLQTSV